LRVHMDLVVSPQMLEDGDEVLILPAATRYEVPGGITETSTERRIIYSPQVKGSRHPEAVGEWEFFGELAARVKPELRGKVRFASTAAVRAEIGQIVPLYSGIQNLSAKGDNLQYGGERLCEGWEFKTDDGRARFTKVEPQRVPDDDGRLRLTTRRGKQFNSMVQERKDSLTGAEREAVLISEADAGSRGLSDGDQVLVRSDHGELTGTVLLAPVKPGNVQVHWPEGNVLMDRTQRSPQAGVPDYNAWVEVVSLP
ncbi:MAG: hypothetical protein QOF68_430, partial [Gaiellales bacterium]|nr:hypothetical protein [Gaiellales bacterium]